jgi:uncharacterized protein
MRLYGYLKNTIKTSLQALYIDADIIIFGSRADNNKQGGDIDIAIKTNISSAEFNQKKILFFTDLLRKGIDIKVDLVQFYAEMNGLLKSEIERKGKLL